MRILCRFIALTFAAIVVASCSLVTGFGDFETESPDGDVDGDVDDDADTDGDSDTDADSDVEPAPCERGTPCFDDNPCTQDICEPALDGADPLGCVFPPEPNGHVCDGMFLCVLDEVCADGVCNPDTGVPACEDGFECSRETCEHDSGACTGAELDHDFCFAVDPGRPWCDPWVTDADPITGCTRAPGCLSNAECDDHDPCNGVEQCDGGVCHPGTSVACATAGTCQDAYCDGSTGDCVVVPVHARCDDPRMCWDGLCDPYASGSDPTTGCVSEPVHCVPDDNPCTVELETCSAMFGCSRGATCGPSDGCCPYGCSGTSDSDRDCDDCPTAPCDAAVMDGCCPMSRCGVSDDADCCELAGCGSHDLCCPTYCDASSDPDCPSWS